MRRLQLIPLALALFACKGEPDLVTGGFDESVIDRSVRHGQGLRVVDIDGDGRPDVVSALSLTDSVHVYLAQEDLTAPWERISVSGPSRIVAMDVEVADLDGDGDLDIAAVGLFQRKDGVQSPGEVVWYENPGDVRGVWLTHRVSVPILSNEAGGYVGGIYGARSIQIDDMDGDGDQDLVVGALETVPQRFDLIPPEGICGQVDALGNGIFWFPNRGDGRFEGPLPVDPNLDGVSQVVLGDIDGDGRVDVLATASITQAIVWYQNLASDAGPKFVRYTLRANGGQYYGLAAADIDGDSALEIVVAVVRTNGAFVHAYNPPADLTAVWNTSTVATGIGALACDDNEGCPRLADFCNTIEVCTGTVAVEPPTPCDPVDPDTLPQPTGCMDVQQCTNGPPGQLEPVACTTNDECPRVVDVCSEGFCPAVAQNPVITVGDFTGDGRSDVVVGEATGELRIYSQQDNGVWQRRDVRSGYTGINFLAGGDIDLDGRLDFVSSTYEFGTRDRVSWWRNVDN